MRQFAERTAINTPIQGSAADLIKLAMVRLEARLARERGAGAMILQVHDELVFEARRRGRRDAVAVIREEMESVSCTVCGCRCGGHRGRRPTGPRPTQSSYRSARRAREYPARARASIGGVRGT